MPDPEPEPINLRRRQFLRTAGAGTILLGATGGWLGDALAASDPSARQGADASGSKGLDRTVAADATRTPGPITRDHAVHHDIELVAREVEARLDDGTTFTFMTWNGQVPGPMIRVRQGDSISLTLTNPSSSTQPHNIDLHAVYGTGGGSEATMTAPGQSKIVRFQCVYPGAFVYHCAVPNMDEHISRGMFGMIVVEPPEGLPAVDREFYIGQHELYTLAPAGDAQPLPFDYAGMIHEQPSYVLFNGLVDGYTPGRLGRLQARVGETIRVFMACGGPNLLSSFHPIGNVWARCWPQGAFANPPLAYVQTQPVPPGSCFVGDMNLPVPQTIKLVDHALSRVVRQGLLAEIEVTGKPNLAVFDASPS